MAQTPLQKKYAYLNDSGWWAKQLYKGKEQYAKGQELKQSQKDAIEYEIGIAIRSIMRIGAIIDSDRSMWPDNAQHKRFPKPYDWENSTLDTPLQPQTHKGVYDGGE